VFWNHHYLKSVKVNVLQGKKIFYTGRFKEISVTIKIKFNEISFKTIQFFCAVEQAITINENEWWECWLLTVDS